MIFTVGSNANMQNDLKNDESLPTDEMEINLKDQIKENESRTIVYNIKRARVLLRNFILVR